MQEICFYGERGIVNGLVLDIWEDLNLIRSVLRTIDWCRPSEHGWIDNLSRVTFLVEPGFGKFGQPDLLMICDIEDESKRWLFIEAKSTPYYASSMSNQKGMTVKGYNSSINGQLSLDYRLALALERYEIGPILEESSTVFEQYRKRLLDYNNGPRKVAKPELLKGIVNPYLQDLQLEKTFFVAMTRDEGLNPINSAAEDELPLVIDESGNNRWNELGAHFGFLSLKELDLDVLKLDGYYRRGCQLHIGPWIEEEKPKEFVDAPLLITVNWIKFPDQWVKKVDELAMCIKENIRPWGECIRYQGSYSFKVKGKTIGKLLLINPEDPQIMVGFSIVVPNHKSYARILGIPQKMVMGSTKEPFLMVTVDRTDEVCQIMSEFLTEF